MSTLNDNRLHADPDIQGTAPHADRSAPFETPMQRDHAVTIFEKSKPGRRAFVAPELDGVELLHEQPVVREFAVRLDAPVHAVIDRCAAEGVNPGFPLEDDGLLIAITEQRSREDIDRLVSVLGAAVAAEREQVPA